MKSSSIIPGSTVDERFTLTRHLGKGSMGTVWLARHLALDIDVALKFIDSSLTEQPDYVERFRREARAAAQIKSPHVVSVLDYGTDAEGRPFMAMEYLAGATLGEYLRASGRLSASTVARVVAHAARGLGKAHSLGVVHRDIKPENLFICGESEEESFVLKVLDFGVAKASSGSGTQATLAGQLIGSPAYMSPEQAHGNQSVDHRTDLFSLAVVAYQCLTGRRAFKGNGVGELLLSICATAPDAPTTIVPDLPPEIDAWFEKALAKNAHERFQSARELATSLCDVLGIHVASGIDLVASSSTLSRDDSFLSLSREISSSAPFQSSEEETRIITPTSRTPSLPSATLLHAGSIVDVIAPLTGVPHTLGVALLDQQGECLLMRGTEQKAMTFSAIAAHARTVAATVESIEATKEPSQLSARFEQLAIYVRWLGPFTLVVYGDSQLRALLLTVGSNKLETRLEEFMSQLGGALPVAEALREAERESRAVSGVRSPGDSPKKRVKLYRGKVVE